MYVESEFKKTFIDYTPKTFEDIPEEILLNIFRRLLSLNDIASTRLVCHQWKRIASDDTTIFGQYNPEIQKIQNLSHCLPACSEWKLLPEHWKIIDFQFHKTLKFSFCSSDFIALSPQIAPSPFDPLPPSKFYFNTSELTNFSDQLIFLNEYNGIFFLTPQCINGELKRHTMVVFDSRNPSKKMEFSVQHEKMLISECQILTCIPLSETKIVILTCSKEISFWDISQENPECYKKFFESELGSISNIFKVGNFLLLDKTLINLTDFALIPHDLKLPWLNLPRPISFEGYNNLIKVFSSSFCLMNFDPKIGVGYYSINDQGLIKEIWNYQLEDLMKSFPEFVQERNRALIEEFKELGGGDIDELKQNRLIIRDINQSFILLEGWNCFIFRHLIILNTKGELVHAIHEETHCASIPFVRNNPWELVARLSENVLFYKKPDATISFWFLPTKKHILDFDWGTGVCMVQDIYFQKGNLYLLLSLNEPFRYKLIQYKPQFASTSGGSSANFCSLS